jgi:hypothetical protein
MDNYPPALGGHLDYNPPKNDITMQQYSNQIIVVTKSNQF